MNTYDPTKKLRTLLIAALFGLGTVAVGGCDVDEGPAEEFGESVDDAADETQDAAEEAGQELEEAGEELDDEL